MILISAGLVLTAIVLLIVGIVLAKPFLVMWSIAVSVLSAVFLVIGALLRRHELFPGGQAGAAQPLPEKGPMPAGPVPAPHGVPNQPPVPPHMMAQHGMRQQMPVAPTQPRRGPVAGPATATAARRGALDAEAIVLVIPGRKRYHVAGCRQLAGRDHEELTHEEAREEGFTPCTSCLPESTAGNRPYQTPPGVREPAEPLSASPESGPAGGAGEPGPHEATARFTAPYRPARPAAPAGGQQAPGARPEPQPRPENPAAGRESAVSRQEPPQEPVVPVARPYVHSSEPQVRPQEPVSPPLRAAESPTPSVPIRLPKVPEIPHADSEATSWFSRDMVVQASKPETPVAPARPEPEAAEPVKPGAAVGGTSASRGEAPESAKPETGETERTGPGAVEPEPAVAPVTASEPAASEDAKTEAVKTEAVKTGAQAKAEVDGRDSAPSEPSPSGRSGAAGSGSAEPERSGEPGPREKPDSGHQATADGTGPEPVEPAETAPGRAGQVTADSTSVEPAADPSPEDQDADNAPGAGEQQAGDGTVMVIIGTRRFHDPACPLIKGAGDSGTEVVSLVEAEGAGLVNCSICLNDHRDQS
ncbi:hypothetical protein [Streptosporangium amethystogenes]|uniref:hypothetical protein n=1 Tax=Streptosporangium amethystogenes TaxID=2002 RepID=UPI0004CA779D|nr:hypothetical protein [Streptosporangium amethystogenes]